MRGNVEGENKKGQHWMQKELKIISEFFPGLADIPCRMCKDKTVGCSISQSPLKRKKVTIATDRFSVSSFPALNV